ncbi:MAG: tRNA (adenosine(37)-N6)-threonylcarbamoyltransferase complex dimerization subunit type 1 TsaB [Anaeromyxobacteraceae bacterium]
MLIAALDTATLALSSALVELAPGAEPRVVRARTEHAPAKPGPGQVGGHGHRLPGILTDLLAEAGLELSAIEGYAIGIGPGSFTGLRIGLATWKGLAYAARRPLAGASSLAAMALAAARTAPAGTLLVPALDAKKNEVYAGFYRAAAGRVEAAAPEAALPAAALAGRLEAEPGAVVFGPGREAYAAALEPFARPGAEVAHPGAVEIAALAAPRLLGVAFDPQAIFALEPHYVRASEAELKFPHGLGPGAGK